LPIDSQRAQAGFTNFFLTEQAEGMIDASLNLQAGDILTWENYPLWNNEKKDRRWFLFLGFQSLDAIVYQVTTTTQYAHYESVERRKVNNFFKVTV
jgi:hypothetical protein